MCPYNFRISFLVWLLLGSSLLGCGGPKGQQSGGLVAGAEVETHSSQPDSPGVKNVILMIGDGMGLQQVSQAVLYRQLRQPTQSPLALETLLDSPNSGLMRTSSYGDIVTDSAAAATVMACGMKTLNEMVGMDPNGYPCETILEKAAKQGKATGLVSTARLTHATPAGFVAHQVFRNMENEIAEDIVEDHDVNVLLSGGIRYFIPQFQDEVKQIPMKSSQLAECRDIDPQVDGTSKRKDQKNLIASAKSKGYQFVCNREQLEKLAIRDDTKVLGLFSSSVFPMVQERNAIGTLPDLAAMTRSALDILQRDQDGFFLMVEGGLIDYAGHDNDAGTMLQETLDFDRAVAVAVDFVKKNPQTLLIVTADHETGGFGFAYGKKISFEMALPSGLRYQKPYDFAPFTRFDYLVGQKKSFRAMLGPIEAKLYPETGKEEHSYGLEQAAKDLVQVVQANSDFTLSEAQAREVLERKPGKSDAEPHDFGSFYVHASVHPDMLGRVLADQSSTVWATGTHTSTPVPVMALGPDRYSKQVQGFIDNTQITKIIEDAYQGR